MSSSTSGIIKTHTLFCLCRPKGKEIYYSPQHPKDLLTTIQQKRWCLRKYTIIYVKTHYNILHQHLITTAQSTLCNPKLPFVYFRFKASKIKIAYNKCIIIHMESKVRKLQCRGKCRRARIVLPAFPWINKSILSNTCGVVHLLLNNLHRPFAPWGSVAKWNTADYCSQWTRNARYLFCYTFWTTTFIIYIRKSTKTIQLQ